ncbi:MAG: dTDP-4-dehydrorhamnose reductase [Betaproteobacteria bacterium]
MGIAADTPRILITGADGQLGWELQRSFASEGEIFAFDRSAMDLSSPDAIRSRCREIRPTLILNAGAYTAVDKAESEPDMAMRINGEAPGILAEEANKLNAVLVHYSTDYVFDGTAGSPYRETDTTAPQNVYGRTKLAGEQAVSTMAKRFATFRTSWLYGNRRHNFMLTMLRLAREREELRVVADQTGSPTWVRAVAEATRECVQSGALRIEPGIYHLTANGQTTWHGFATAILDGTAGEPRLAQRVVAINSGELAMPAKRPSYSVLSLSKLELALGHEMTDWQEQLRRCIAERKSIDSSTGAASVA